MTLIAAVVGPDLAVMIGDSCVTTGDDLIMLSRAPKVAHVGPWLVGAAGDAGACTELLSREWPVGPRLLRGRLRTVKGSWEALLARPGELWVADSDGCLEPVARPYWAIGSGGQIGLGALAGLLRGRAVRHPSRILTACAEITAGVRGDVSGPFTIVLM